MTGMVQLSWSQVRTHAMDALRATLERLARVAPADPLCADTLALPVGGKDLEVWASTARRWVDQQFFVVDAELDESRPENRQMVKLRRFQGRHIWLTLPPDTRTALDGRRLRVFCVSDVEIRLKQALLRALKEASSGKLVEQLWSTERPTLTAPPTNPPGDRALNGGQRDALAAMSSPGAWLVWGPPGTGKTTVITAAVRDALAHARSVLIASHTHVAVDNVLEGLFAPGDGSAPPRPGEIIRLASPATLGSVSPAVREHDYAMLDKAVAQLTGQVERQADLDGRRELNRTNQVRDQLQQAIEELSGVDLGEIERAQQAAAAREAATHVQPHVTALEQRISDAERKLEAHREAAEAMEISAGELREAQAAAERTRDELAGDERALAEAGVAVRSCRRERAAAGDRLYKARAAVDQGLGRLLTPVRERRARHAEELTARADKAEAALGAAEDSHARWTEVLREAKLTLTEAESQLRKLRDRAEQAVHEAQKADELAGELQELRAEHAPQAEQLADLRALMAAVPEDQALELLAKARESGVLENLERRELLNKEVARLDKELKQLDREQARLDEEVANERARLIAEAPVIACTLAALTTSQRLLERRFDVVILDEAASIEAPYVAFAGTRANRTLALVGDFLQNAPIADADDVLTDEDRPRAEWQKRDIFHLAGIRDRASAESHPRCVALRTQYRYPPLIAETVNAFCYDGLLESHDNRAPTDGPLVTLIDTTSHPGKELQRERNSWFYQLGLDLLEALAHEAAQRTADIGYICPYTPQAHRAQRLSDRKQLGIQCGTAHRFQGREFDTVIVDLMQDSRPRWSGTADLQGTDHQVAAAKLLNVALTRAKTRLYLIGDWDFILRYDSPGMRAIAALDGHPEFQVIDALEITPS
jgi:AAA domain-containing protein